MHPGPGGLAALDLYANDDATARVAHARVFAHGAHVAAWTPPGEPESRLFLSSRATFAPGRAIRGGVPVVFPQFSDTGPYERHGFARTLAWTLEAAGRDGAAAFARLALAATTETRARWPHAFRLWLDVRVEGQALDLALTAFAPPGADGFAATLALHTYLAVSDAAQARVEGLSGLRYRDTADGGTEKIDRADALAFAGGAEVDRLYLGVPGPLALVDGARRLRIEQTGFEDAVVWNPGAEKGAVLADLGPGEHARFVCVEAAQVARPVRLAPGEAWTGRQRLVVEA